MTELQNYAEINHFSHQKNVFPAQELIIEKKKVIGDKSTPNGQIFSSCSCIWKFTHVKKSNKFHMKPWAIIKN